MDGEGSERIGSVVSRPSCTSESSNDAVGFTDDLQQGDQGTPLHEVNETLPDHNVSSVSTEEEIIIDDDSSPEEETIDSSDHSNSEANGLAKTALRMERELKSLTFINPGPQFDQKSLYTAGPTGRRQRKTVQKLELDTGRLRGKTKKPVYDKHGRYIADESQDDFCDCLMPDCPGCHMPCPTCGDRKCGHECRCERTWTYTEVVIQGSDVSYKNPHVAHGKTRKAGFKRPAPKDDS